MSISSSLSLSSLSSLFLLPTLLKCEMFLLRECLSFSAKMVVPRRFTTTNFSGLKYGVVLLLLGCLQITMSPTSISDSLTCLLLSCYLLLLAFLFSMFALANLCLFNTFLQGNCGNNPLTVRLNSNSQGGIFVVE